MTQQKLKEALSLLELWATSFDYKRFTPNVEADIAEAERLLEDFIDDSDMD